MILSADAFLLGGKYMIGEKIINTIVLVFEVYLKTEHSLEKDSILNLTNNPKITKILPNYYCAFVQALT